MFGLFFGTVCLVALVVVVARGRRRFGRLHGYGHHGPRSAINHLLARLDTAPGQEKVIVAAVEDLVDRARESGRKVRDTRRDIALSLRGEQMDDARLSEVFGRHDAALNELRSAGVEALRKIHEALDERQRRVLGELVESGGYFGFHRAAYCH